MIHTAPSQESSVQIGLKSSIPPEQFVNFGHVTIGETVQLVTKTGVVLLEARFDYIRVAQPRETKS